MHVVIVTPRDTLSYERGPASLWKVGGLPLVARAVRTARKAGASDVMILSPSDAQRAALARYGESARVVDAEDLPAEVASEGGPDVLVVRADALLHPDDLKAAMAAERWSGECALVGVVTPRAGESIPRSCPLGVRKVDGRVAGVGAGPSAEGARPAAATGGTGPAGTRAEHLAGFVRCGRKALSTFARHVTGESTVNWADFVADLPHAGCVQSIDAGKRYHALPEVHGSACAMERELFESFRREVPGPVARHINKRISIPISRLLVHLPFTPNQLTVLNVLLGLCAILVAAKGGYWGILGGLTLFWGCAVFDGCDGEVAKARLQDSPFGAHLDTLSDATINLTFWIGFVTGLSKGPRGDLNVALGLTILLCGAITIAILIAWNRIAPAGKFSFDLAGNAFVASQKAGSSSRLKTAISTAVREAGRKDFYSFFFLPFGLLGLGEVVLWLTTIAIAVMMVVTVQQFGRLLGNARTA